MRARSFLLVSGAMAAALGVAALAKAQDRPGPPADGPMGAQMRQHMQEQHERMLQDVHTILRLRPDQEAAFKTLQDALHPPGPPQGMGTMQPPPEGLTTPQMLDRMSQLEARARAEMDRRHAAILAFYKVLSPDQQQTFDALMRMHHGMMGGGMVMMRGGGMMGMGGGRMIILRHGAGGPDEPPPPPGE